MFPIDDGASPRKTSVDIPDTKLGKTTYKRTESAEQDGDSLHLDAGGVRAISYGIYRFDGLADEDIVLSVDVERTDLQAEEGYYLAIADFDNDRWLWTVRGSTQPGTTTDTIALGGVEGISPNGYVYIAILVYNGGEMWVDSVTLTCDVDIEAPVADFTATPTSGNSPLEVEFDAGDSIVRGGGSVDSYAWDFENDGTIDETHVIATASYTYPLSREYEARLIVTADNGFTDEHIVRIHVHSWAHTWGGVYSDYVSGVTFSGDQIFTCGVTTGTGGTDFLVTCFEASGEPRWQQILNCYTDTQPVIATLDRDSVVVAGRSTDTGVIDCVLVAAYNHAGEILWQKAWDNGRTLGNPSIAEDGTGNIYIAVSYQPESTINEIAILKYSSTGELLWQRFVSFSEGLTYPTLNYFFGALYLAAAYDGTDIKLALIKFDPDGILTDRGLYELGETTHPYAVRADLSGSVYITGRYQSVEDRAFLMKTNSSLVAEWVKSWNHSEGAGIGRALNFFQAGETDDIQVVVGITNTTDCAAIMWFDNTGNLQDARIVTHPGSNLYLRAMSEGANGAVVLGDNAENASGLQLTVTTPTVVNLLYDNSDSVSTEGNLTGSDIDPDTTTDNPPGVLDTGGGGDDLLLIELDLDDL